MSVTLDISDQLADLLRALAAQRGMSVEALGQQALAVGLTTLTSGAGDGVDIDLAQAGLPAHARVLMPSPTVVSGLVRPLQITFEPDTGAPANAH
jgi:hypothetical protein